MCGALSRVAQGGVESVVGRAAASARVERGWGAEVDPPAAGEIVRCVEWVHMM